MKNFTLTLVLACATCTISNAQSSKFRFMIDGNQYLDIRENAGGLYRIHQHNEQTSMFFGFNSGINTIQDQAIFGSGNNNTSYGFNSMSANVTGFRNTAIGSNALADNISGSTNVAIGFSALSHSETASDNIGIGKSALLNNINGSANVAVGGDAFNNTNYAHRSVAIGSTAGVNDTSSVDNTYVGFGAGRGTIFSTDGYDRYNNVMIGSQSGYFCETNGNVFLGNKAGMNANADNQLYITNTNSDSLNSLIYGQFDNSLLRINGELNIDGLYTFPTSAPTDGDVLRRTGTDLTWYDLDVTWETASGDDVVYEDGDIGIGIGNPIYRLDVEDNLSTGYIARFHNASTSTSSRGIIIQTGPITNPSSSVYYTLFLDGNGTNIGGIRGNGAGGTMYSTTSDRRLKQNIKTYTKGLETISLIHPTIYQMKSNPSQDEIGFIAQELQEIVPGAVSGNPEDNVDESPMMVDYSRLTPVIVAAIQEQQELIAKQKSTIEKLVERLDKLEQSTAALIAEMK